MTNTNDRPYFAVDHHYLKTPTGEIEITSNADAEGYRCPACGQYPPLISISTSERATYACMNQGCPNHIDGYKWESEQKHIPIVQG